MRITAADHELSQQAAGMRVFPSVIKADIGVGGSVALATLSAGGLMYNLTFEGSTITKIEK